MSTVLGDVIIENTLSVKGKNFDAIGEAALLGSSTGITSGGVLSIASATEFNISAGEGIIYSISGNIVTENKVVWSAFNNIAPTYLITNIVTHVFINGSGNVVQQSTLPTPEQFRTLIYVGRILHLNQTTINGVINSHIPAYQPMLHTIDLARSIGIINSEGNIFTPNGANLSLDKSFGVIFSLGNNYSNFPNNPNFSEIAQESLVDFTYRFQNGTNLSSTTVINPAIYDLNGVSTPVPSDKFTTQRIFLYPSGGVRIQPGQALYDTMAEAKAAVGTEPFVTEENNAIDASLRAVLIVKGNATDLSNSTQAAIIHANMLGEFAIGTSVTTLQNAYNNSKEALITTSTTQNAIKIKRGTASDTDNVLEILDGTGDTTFYIKGDGTSSNTVHTHVAADITDLSKTSVGLGNVQNVDQTNASNITSGTLSNARLTTNLSQLGGITFVTNDFIQYNGSTLINVTPTQVKNSIGLSNVSNNLQVINAGNGVSYASGLLSSRPIAGTNGRLFVTTDSGPYFDNGSSWVSIQSPITGDVSIPANSTTATLPTINVNVGTFNNLTVNGKGQVTAATNANYLTDSGTNGVVVRTSLNTTTARTITGTTNQVSVTNGDGVGGNPVIAVADNPVIPGTASMTIPTGTTAQRPSASPDGQVRFNSTLLLEEISDSNVWRPFGRVLQTVTGTIPQTSGTTQIPFDATLPTSTEGFQIFSASITPYYAGSTITVMFNIAVAHSTNNRTVTTVLYINNTASAVNATIASGGQIQSSGINHSFSSPGTSPISITARVGGSGGGTAYVNRGTTQTYGGAIASSYIIMEVI